MTDLFCYSLLSSIVLTVLWGAYGLCLKGERFHDLNRMALWSIMILSVAVPLFPAIKIFSDSQPQGDSGMIQIGDITAQAVDADPTGPGMMQILAMAYAIVAAILLVAGGVALVRLLVIIGSGTRFTTPDETEVIVTECDDIAPFSFCRLIVMGREDFANNCDMIVRHESAHISQGHFVDLLASRLVCVLQWYNPCAWLMGREIAAVHEYLADRHVLESGADDRRYQMLLVERSTGIRMMPLANSLNNSKLKKRIIMMKQISPAPRRALRVLALVPALAAAIAITNIPAIASTLRTTDKPVADGGSIEEVTVVAYTDKASKPVGKVVANQDNNVYDVVETMPQFPGGENELLKFIAMNIRYPQKAQQDGVNGRVVLQFVVGADGKAVDPVIIRSVSPELDAEACRIVGILPAFTPGKVNGENVAVRYTLPIAFKLTGNDKKGQKLPDPAYFVDGKQVDDIKSIAPDQIQSMDIIKDDPEYPDGKIMIKLKK